MWFIIVDESGNTQLGSFLESRPACFVPDSDMEFNKCNVSNSSDARAKLGLGESSSISLCRGELFLILSGWKSQSYDLKAKLVLGETGSSCVVVVRGIWKSRRVNIFCKSESSGPESKGM